MQRYLEIRNITSASTSVPSDLAQHLLARQHLGKAIVVCDKPVIRIGIMRKHWFRQTRNVQRERSSTLNVERILQLTHDITRMQRMDFVARPFPASPMSDVFFVTADQLDELPPNCYSMYIVSPPTATQLRSAIDQLPNRSLVIDYSHDPAISQTSLLPKAQLEQLVPCQWQGIEDFFGQHNIDVHALAARQYSACNIDNELDSILDSGNRFVSLANDFLELLRLAQPMPAPSSQQKLYDLIVILQRRVSALTPGLLSQQFAQSFRDEDALSFHDVATEQWMSYEDDLDYGDHLLATNRLSTLPF